MKCPVCNSTRSNVLDSRKREEHIHRSRECKDCGGRFSTYEITDEMYFEFKTNMNDFKEELTEFIKSYGRIVS